jgi:hypothetical protein
MEIDRPLVFIAKVTYQIFFIMETSADRTILALVLKNWFVVS